MNRFSARTAAEKVAAAEARRPLAAEWARGALGGVTAASLAEEVSARVVGQDDAVRDVCSFLVSALGRVERLCSGVPESALPHLDAAMVDGPTGCGKTYLVQCACRALGLGVAAVDGSSLTGAGWAGGDISAHLYRVAQDQAHPGGERATVVFVDEFDKMAKDDSGPNKGFSPCPGLLRVIEGSEVLLVDPPDRDGEALALDKSLLIFVLAGCFAGLDEAVRARLSRESGGCATGFAADPGALAAARATGQELRAAATPEDLVACGLPRELVGRVTTLARVSALGEAELARIARGAEGSAAERFGAMMPAGCRLDVDDSAVALVAAEAAAAGRGARGIEAALGGACLRAVEEARTDETVVLARVSAAAGGLEVAYERGEREPAGTESPEAPAAAGAEAPAAAGGGRAPAGGPAFAGDGPGWDPPARVGAPAGLPELAVELRAREGAAAPDPVAYSSPAPRGFSSGGADAQRVADAVVSVLLRDMPPARALVARELVYGCLTFLRHWRPSGELGSPALLALVREEAEGRLRARVVAVCEGRPLDGDAARGDGWRGRRGDPALRTVTCGIEHAGVSPREDSALRRLAYYWLLAGDDARAIAREVADRIEPLAGGPAPAD